MIQRKQDSLSAVYLLIDAAGSMIAMLAAYWLRFGVEIIPVTKGQQDVRVYAAVLPIVAIVFPLAFSIQGLYRNRSSRVEEWISVIVGTIFGTVVLSGVLLWLRPGDPGEFYSRATLLIFMIAEVVIVMFGRSLIRNSVEAQHRIGKDLDRVIIAGNGELARAVYERLIARREMGFEVVGFLEHNPGAGGVADLRRLGTIDEAIDVLRQHDVQHVFVAVPQESSLAMMQLLDQLVRDCVSIHVVPDLLQFMVLRSRVEDVGGLPTINLSEPPLSGWSIFTKRAFDLLVAAAALLILSPLMGLIAFLIWLEDRGPIFYRQVRMGFYGAPFQILKFRSMRLDAENLTGAVWADRDDPRRTRIGKWIRMWSIDELPQLINVLRGEMSVVGPRPERPQFVEQFRAQFPHYMLRHKVRAGMTGWAQVHGWRGNTSIRMRIEHDLYYIENWSLMLDLKIVFMTLRHGLRHENAY